MAIIKLEGSALNRSTWKIWHKLSANMGKNVCCKTVASSRKSFPLESLISVYIKYKICSHFGVEILTKCSSNSWKSILFSPVLSTLTFGVATCYNRHQDRGIQFRIVYVINHNLLSACEFFNFMPIEMVALYHFHLVKRERETEAE